jgi:predicted HicB family RNase H-like nuclease
VPEPIKSIHTRLPADLHEYLAARAWRADMSLNSLLVSLAARSRQLDERADETVRLYREHRARARAARET